MSGQRSLSSSQVWQRMIASKGSGSTSNKQQNVHIAPRPPLSDLGQPTGTVDTMPSDHGQPKSQQSGSTSDLSSAHQSQLQVQNQHATILSHQLEGTANTLSSHQFQHPQSQPNTRDAPNVQQQHLQPHGLDNVVSSHYYQPQQNELPVYHTSKTSQPQQQSQTDNAPLTPGYQSHPQAQGSWMAQPQIQQQSTRYVSPYVQPGAQPYVSPYSQAQHSQQEETSHLPPGAQPQLYQSPYANTGLQKGHDLIQQQVEDLATRDFRDPHQHKMGGIYNQPAPPHQDYLGNVSLGYQKRPSENGYTGYLSVASESHYYQGQYFSTMGQKEVPMHDEDLIGLGDELLEMQNNAMSTATFEDSVASFVGARSQARGARNHLKGALVEARGQHPRRRVIRRGPRKAAEPTGDVKMRLNNATTSYLAGRLDEALNYVNDAIRINAEIHRAWSLLAQIHLDKGNHKESLLASVCAAHLQPKILEGWMHCSFLAVELMDELPDDADDLSRIAISTFSQAIQVEPKNMVARQGRAALLLARENYKSAIAQYAYLVEHNHTDVMALRGLVEATVKWTETAKKDEFEGKQEAARDAYRRCITHCQANGMDPELPFDWDDASIYIELLTRLEQYEDALKETRSIARWLLERQEEDFWDKIDDDREWDEDDERRAKIDNFIPEKHPASTYGTALPPQLRAKLCVCRLRLGHEEEAKLHMDWLDPVDESASDIKSQYPELFLEVATAAFKTKKLALALRFYEPLRDNDELDATSLVRAGKCYLDEGDKRKAEECFTKAIDLDESGLDARISARYELAKMYEAAKHDEEAYILLNEAMNLEGEREGADSSQEYSVEPYLQAAKYGKSILNAETKPKRAQNKPKKPREPRTVKHKELRVPRVAKTVNRQRPMFFALDEERKAEEDKRSKHLANMWADVRNMENKSPDGGPSGAWLEAARELIDDFRSFKAFYPWDRYLIHMGLRQDRSSTSSTNPTLLKMAERLRDNLNPQLPSQWRADEITVSYRDVSWQEWLDLFIEYALSIAIHGKIKDAYAILDAARDANVFYDNPEDLFLIHVAIAAVALRGRDEEKCVEMARFFMAKNLFASDAFRMYSALCRLCASSAAWFADTRVQKFILRQIKFMDSAMLPPDEKDKPLDEFDPAHYPAKELHLPLIMLYGHILFISNSFTYALNYFVRAHAIDPDNIMVNISIGQAYLHYALKRQAENRQHLIVQGFSFLRRYYELRLEKSSTTAQRQEAHYNLARSYHAVGLSHLAIEYYRRVLREVEGQEESGDENLAIEAAFNMQQLCLVGGDMGAATALTQKYLVF